MSEALTPDMPQQSSPTELRLQFETAAGQVSPDEEIVPIRGSGIVRQWQTLCSGVSRAVRGVRHMRMMIDKLINGQQAACHGYSDVFSIMLADHAMLRIAAAT